jgi:hypothetical protein
VNGKQTGTAMAAMGAFLWTKWTGPLVKPLPKIPDSPLGQCHNLEVPMLILRSGKISGLAQEVELIQSCDGRFWQGSHPDGCPRKLLEIKSKRDRRKCQVLERKASANGDFLFRNRDTFKPSKHQHAGCITLLSNSAVRLVILVSTSLSKVA